MNLTDEPWTVLEPLIPEPPRREGGRGRPWRSNREVLDGILWILRTGAPWMDLPRRYPPYQVCHRRFQAWVRSGVLDEVLQALARDLEATPQKLIGNKAYDSHPLDGALKEQGIELIAPQRRIRSKPKTQDGRKLRRYKRRWKVEWLIDWLQNYRCVAARYERHACNFLGLAKLAAALILLRAFMR